jgi:hypothetical protein
MRIYQTPYFLSALILLTIACNRTSDVTVQDNTSQSIIGTWVEPNPVNNLEVQGFELKADGSAASINMATLLYQSWWTRGDSLWLVTQSIGNKTSSVDTMSYAIRICTDEQLVLVSESREISYQRKSKP